MSASGDVQSDSRKRRIATRWRVSVASLALIGLMASSPQAFALKIPIQASLSGGGEGAFEQ